MAEAARRLELVDEAGEERLDERLVPRTSVHVEIDFSSEHNFWTGLTMNISEGGVFVATHAAVPVGTLLVVHMTLPGMSDEIVTLAEVRWTRAFTDQADVPPGLGLQFVALDAGDAAKIRSFVAKGREPLFFDD